MVYLTTSGFWMLGRIFEPNTDEIIEAEENCYNEELYKFYSSITIIRMMKSMRIRWAGYMTHTSETKNAYRILVGKPQGRRTLGKHGSRWEGNTKLENKDRLGQ
jgi:hypothetical protein